MSNIRLAGDHLYENLLFSWLSLMMSMIAFVCAVFSHEIFWMRPGTYLSHFLRVNFSGAFFLFCHLTSRKKKHVRKVLRFTIA